METSAKDSTNVEQAFMAMASSIKDRYSFFFYNLNVDEQLNMLGLLSKFEQK